MVYLVFLAKRRVTHQQVVKEKEEVKRKHLTILKDGMKDGKGNAYYLHVRYLLFMLFCPSFPFSWQELV